MEVSTSIKYKLHIVVTSLLFFTELPDMSLLKIAVKIVARKMLTTPEFRTH